MGLNLRAWHEQVHHTCAMDLCDPGSPRPGPPTGGSVLRKDGREWGQVGLDSSPLSATYQLCGNVAASHLSALSLGFSSFAGLSRGCGAQPSVRPKLGGPSSGEPGMLQGWPPLGTARLPLSLSSLPRCSLRERLEKHIQKKGPMSLHILFPLLTMLFLAFSSLPWIPPSRFKSHPLCEAGHAAEKAHSQESTDVKTELQKREVMHPLEGKSQDSSPGSAAPPNASPDST